MQEEKIEANKNLENENSRKRKNDGEPEVEKIEIKIRRELQSFKQLDKKLMLVEDSWEHEDLFDFVPISIKTPTLDKIIYPPIKNDRPEVETRASKAYKLGQIAIQRPRMPFNTESSVASQPYSKSVIEKWDNYLNSLDITPDPDLLKPDFVDHAAEIAEKIRYGLDPKYEHVWEVNHRFDPEFIFDMVKDKIDATVSKDKRIITYQGNVYHCKDQSTSKAILGMILTKEKDIPRSVVNNLKRYRNTTTFYRRWPRFFSDDRTTYEPNIEENVNKNYQRPISELLVEAHSFIMGKKIKRFRLQDVSAKYMQYSNNPRTSASKYELVLPYKGPEQINRRVLIISSEKSHNDHNILALVNRFAKSRISYACKLYAFEKGNAYRFGDNVLSYVPENKWLLDYEQYTDIIVDVVDVISQRNMTYGLYTSANTIVSKLFSKLKITNKSIKLFGRIGIHENFPIEIDRLKINYMFHKASGFEIVFSASRDENCHYDDTHIRRMISAKTLIEYDRNFMNDRSTGIYYYDPEYPVKDDPFASNFVVPIVITNVNTPVVRAYDGMRSKTKFIQRNDFSVLGMVAVRKDDNISIIADLMVKNNFDNKRVREELKNTYPHIAYTAITKIAAYKSIVSYGNLDVRVLRAISMASNAPLSEKRLDNILGQENADYKQIFKKNSDGTYEYVFGLSEDAPEQRVVFPGLEAVRESQPGFLDNEDAYVEHLLEIALDNQIMSDLNDKIK